MNGITIAEGPSAAAAARLVEVLAARPAGAPVLVDRERCWSAAELLTATTVLAGALRDCRAIAVLADNGPASVALDLAALVAGVPRVPLPAFFSPAQLAHVLDAAGVDTVFTDQPERILSLEAGFVARGGWQELQRCVRAPRAVALPEATAAISFTSGSTGAPKGVCLAADGLLATAQAVAARLADLPIERHLAVLPLALLLENVAGVYAPLLRGAQVLVPRLATLGWRGMAGLDAATLQGALARWRPDSAILVPELLKAWSLALERAREKAPGEVVFVAVGGARVDAAAIAKARAVGIPAYQGYGLTECGSVVSLNRPGDDGDDAGRPLAHVGVRIACGEVEVTGPAFLGYLDDKTPSAKAAWFATGDLGRVAANGHLALSGRRKSLLITSFGRNVSPEWVEAALLAQPAIAQAVVAGEARPWLSGVLVPAPGCDPHAVAAAVAAANAGLPDYAQLRCWTLAEPFTLANGLATGNGRPVRAAVLAHHEAPLAALEANEEATHAVP